MSNQSESIYAQILNGAISNIIILSNPALVSLFKKGFDDIVNITNLDPQPKIGDLYDGVQFTDNPNPPPEPDVIIDGQNENADVGISLKDNKALQFCSMDTPTRDQLQSTQGMVVFNTDTNTLNYYNGIKWISI